MKKAVFHLSVRAVVLLAASRLWYGCPVQAPAAEPVAAPASSATGGKTPPRFVISDFGAVADGKTVNTKAIQSAIDKCATSGGGVLVVPKGTFLSGAIFLKQGVNLCVEKDGVSRGPPTRRLSADSNALGRRGRAVDFGIRECRRPDATSIFRARGRSMDRVKSGYRAIRGGRLAEGRSEATAACADRPPAARRGRPRLIGIQNCKHVHVAGLNLHNQAVWCLFILYSEDVVAENLRITAEHNIPSSDGIDIDSCKRVRINNVYIDVNDDCISIKSGKDADGLRVNRPAEDIVVENSHFAYGHGRRGHGQRDLRAASAMSRSRNCVCRFRQLGAHPLQDAAQPRRRGGEHHLSRHQTARDHGRPSNSTWNGGWCGPSRRPPRCCRSCAMSKSSTYPGDVNSVGIIHGLKDSPIRTSNLTIAGSRRNGVSAWNTAQRGPLGAGTEGECRRTNHENGCAIVLWRCATRPVVGFFSKPHEFRNCEAKP